LKIERNFRFRFANCVTSLKLNRGILSEVTSLEMDHIEKFRSHRSEVTHFQRSDLRKYAAV